MIPWYQWSNITKTIMNNFLKIILAQTTVKNCNLSNFFDFKSCFILILTQSLETIDDSKATKHFI